MELVAVCPLEEVQSGVLKSIDVEGVELMITKIDAEIIVSSRICTHKTYDLTKGHYAEGYVTCLLHTSVFDLSDEGDPMNPPATEPLEIYKTQVIDGIVHIEI